MAATIDFQSELGLQEIALREKNDAITNGQAAQNAESVWHDTIKNYFGKIEKAGNSCNAIGNSLSGLKDEASLVASQADTLAKKVKPFVLEAAQALDALETASKGVGEIKAIVAGIGEEEFNKSEIKGKLDGLFKDMEEISAQAKEAFLSALGLYQHAFTFQNAINGEEGFNANIGLMVKYANDSKKAGDSYLAATDTQWKEAMVVKAKWDQLIAERDLASMLVEAYKKAIAVLPEPV